MAYRGSARVKKEKRRAVALVEGGASYTGAAKQIGVDPKTLRNWRSKDELFDLDITKAKDKANAPAPEEHSSTEPPEVPETGAERKVAFLDAYRKTRSRVEALQASGLTTFDIVDFCNPDSERFDQEFGIELMEQARQLEWEIEDVNRQRAAKGDGNMAKFFLAADNPGRYGSKKKGSGEVNVYLFSAEGANDAREFLSEFMGDRLQRTEPKRLPGA